MLIRRRERWMLPEAAVTPHRLYRNRRQIMAAFGGGASAALLLGACDADGQAERSSGERLDAAHNADYSTDDEPTSYEAVTSYNNFYEFGTDKSDPAEHAHRMDVDPWSVLIEGHVGRPGRYAFEDLVDMSALEERIYRLRCVEAWSMVIPWIGVPLARVIDRLEPTSRAKYVQFETLLDRAVMPGTRRPVLDWPYVEGLRMDEAMHPLALIAVGLYGEVLPKQNGAPLRLVVPWKYGFKSIKSIVAMRFVEAQPATSWNEAAPNEYGFYANVNPEVDHPRWSQATERRIGDFFRRDTLMFNGYAEEVAHLYEGMDLTKHF